jgi:hypothetical protein
MRATNDSPRLSRKKARRRRRVLDRAGIKAV